ncbi:helix-turn-helix transcriptional regulator [Sporolactobacillus laevolacticus]|nr:helix-turn-helix transcriptional regulator [Sporolactobacillus laevolacticus]MDN3956181.1 helix-turn-helix transcriptional regulator [Sporolactobacillus laevolacticus]
MLKKLKFQIESLKQKANASSISELAEVVDIRRATLSELANGKRQRIQFDHIEKIAEKLGINDIREIIDFDDK